MSKLLPGDAGGGAACAAGLPANSSAPSSKPAAAAPTAALRSECNEINILRLLRRIGRFSANDR
ncbi:hypothetical protein BST11_20185 [Mycobacterium alsense]|uniref:Uncharacterized protein n=1 Tax=Mycobacterium alsense TaxID=324058 RepID=A0ABX3R4K9_9MYCO|nr:hypothetical protein BST11_20185 [Mycobacterium alsense]ORV93956.1 hypothetical protein AWC11_04640 [Mycobacterium interjectum]